MPLSKSPYFIGTFPSEESSVSPLVPSSTMRELWPGEDKLLIDGSWQVDELRAVQTPLGRVAIIGQCVAPESVLQQEVDSALSRNDLERLTHLSGSYAIIAQQADKITVMSDLIGRNPIYYTQHNGAMIVSSKSLPIAEATDKKIDLANLAARFAYPFVTHLTHEQSYWQDIGVLEGGQRLTVTQSGWHIDSYDSLTAHPDATFQDAAGALRETLQQAIGDRHMSGKIITGDLSGGYDSSSISLLSAALLTPEAKFHSFMFYNGSHRSSEGDLDHARRIAQTHDQIVLHEINTMGSLPYQNILKLPFRDEPDAGSLMPGGRDIAYFNAIRQFGSTLHMGGGGADNLFVPNEAYLADLWRLREFRHFFRDATSLARLHDTTPMTILYRSAHLGAEGLRAALSRFADGIATSKARTPDTLSGESNWLAPHLLTPAARELIAELAQRKTKTFELPEGMTIGDYATLNLLRSEARSYYRYQERVRHLELEYHVPYLDHKVLRACLMTPAWRRANPRIFKNLLVNSLNGLVPPRVFERQTKGDYSADLYQGLRRALPDLLGLMDDSILAELGVINPDEVIQTLECLSTKRFSIAALNRLIATELWLRQLDTSRLPDPLPKPIRRVKQMPEKQEALSAGYYVIAPRVYGAAAHDGSLIFLSETTRNYYTTTPTAGIFLQALNQEGGNIENTLTYLQEIYPTIDAAIIRTDLLACIEISLKDGVVVRSKESCKRRIRNQTENYTSSPSSETLAAWNKNTSVTVAETVIAIGSFAAALLLKRLPFRWTPKILNVLHRVWAHQDATIEEAEHMLNVTHEVTRLYWGRVACLEESITSAFALAVKRRRVQWMVGAAFDYARPHAGILVGDQPVGDGKQLDYVPFLRSSK